MIQPLRTVHRRASLALPVVLAAVMFIGLLARRPLTAASQRIPYSAVLDPARQSEHVWTKHRIRSSVSKNPNDPMRLLVDLHPVDELSGPDLLVYWYPQLPHGDSLPRHALLMGAFESGKPISLPVSSAQGFLILYSLAQQSIVDTAPLESLR